MMRLSSFRSGAGRSETGAPGDGLRRVSWIVLLTVASAGFSLVFACATPFAALATLAGRRMSRRDAFLVVLATWLANQAVGYGLLGYPHTADSFGWGGAIGLAALAALGAVIAVGREPLRTGPVFATMLAFVAAFAVYQLVLLAAALALPASASAFAPSVMFDVLMVNALALLGLLAFVALAEAAGLARLSAVRNEA